MLKCIECGISTSDAAGMYRHAHSHGLRYEYAFQFVRRCFNAQAQRRGDASGLAKSNGSFGTAPHNRPRAGVYRDEQGRDENARRGQS